MHFRLKIIRAMVFLKWMWVVAFILIREKYQLHLYVASIVYEIYKLAHALAIMIENTEMH